MFDSRALTFRNEPFTDFTMAANREAMEQALDRVRAQLGRTYRLQINGSAASARATFRSINPSRVSQVIGLCPDATRAHASRALDVATARFPSWSTTPVQKRAVMLHRMAELLQKRKPEFSAWLIYEVGKSWTEADADVAEAIDFLRYYAELALLPVPTLTPVPGEKNQYVYRALGPVVVIAPWNFPLAILVGMTAAALVAGNTVVAKPSNQSPVIAIKFMELAREAGLPDGVLTLLTGQGSTVGQYLVQDPRTRMIAFTGSRAVGLKINELAARSARGQRWIKRVIAEMGGKNAIIVDASADVQQAVQAVAASAFGYQGQKCSACSRLFVHQSLYNELLLQLAERVRGLRLGPAENPENHLGPVISAEAKKRIQSYIRLGEREGRLALPLREAPRGGYFVPPVILTGLPRSSRLWTEEIFGPVVAVDRFRTFEEALERANATEYGLTGAVFTREERHKAKARARFFCGNLYLNRKATGALVGGHPFGGFNMSGTDSKAGGPEYLGLFQQAQTISEKVCS